MLGKVPVSGVGASTAFCQNSSKLSSSSSAAVEVVVVAILAAAAMFWLVLGDADVDTEAAAGVPSSSPAAAEGSVGGLFWFDVSSFLFSPLGTIVSLSTAG